MFHFHFMNLNKQVALKKQFVQSTQLPKFASNLFVLLSKIQAHAIYELNPFDNNFSVPRVIIGLEEVSL